MTKPLGWTSACALLLGLAVACTGEKKPAAKDSTASTSASAAAAAAMVATAPPPGAPGALAKPLTQYSGDELYAFAHGLNFTGGVEAQRRCRGRAECAGASPRMYTRMRVDAVDGEDSLSATGLPANGVIAARAINRGQAADSIYGTQPGTQYEYYLIVVPGTAQAANWKLEELTTTANGRAHRTVSSGVVKGCGHAFVRGARAAFKTCAQAAAMHNAALTLAPQSDPVDPPIWFACAYGCCIADSSAGA
ncbi:MAG TPA: hypothetical protein VHB25_17095 [Gemmatimonadaceae bacterium]|nr:hypothetical protein [Gemmatimonadaceae bacterium]